MPPTVIAIPTVTVGRRCNVKKWLNGVAVTGTWKNETATGVVGVLQSIVDAHNSAADLAIGDQVYMEAKDADGNLHTMQFIY